MEAREHFSTVKPIRDLAMVASPVVVLAIIGNLVGLGTLAGGLIVNIGYVLMMIFGALLLQRQGSGWAQIGLARPASWVKTILLGMGAFVAAVLIFITIQNVAVILLTTFGLLPDATDQSRFNDLLANRALFVLMIILAWTTIAFGEEMFYRAFLLSRMIDHTAIRPAAALIIGGLVFGIAHFAEGPLGILSNGAFGVLFGWIYLRSGRNLWITIIAHGFMNTLRFSLLYTGAV